MVLKKQLTYQSVYKKGLKRTSLYDNKTIDRNKINYLIQRSVYGFCVYFFIEMNTLFKKIILKNVAFDN